jgi:hypothetical protein
MPGIAGPLDVHIDASELHQLYVDLKAVEGNLRVELRHAIADSGQPLAALVRNAAGWSSRIPGAVKVSASFSTRSAGVAIKVDGGAAPEAAPLENKGQSGTFGHPVYGNREVWVRQQARPFFYRTLSGSSAVGIAEKAILAAMDKVAAKAGFR